MLRHHTLCEPAAHKSEALQLCNNGQHPSCRCCFHVSWGSVRSLPQILQMSDTVRQTGRALTHRLQWPKKKTQRFKRQGQDREIKKCGIYSTHNLDLFRFSLLFCPHSSTLACMLGNPKEWPIISRVKQGRELRFSVLPALHHLILSYWAATRVRFN